MRRKRILPPIAGIAIVLSLLVFTGCYNTPLTTCPIGDTDQVLETSQTLETNQTLDANQSYNASPEDHTQKIVDNHHATQDSVRQISSKKAREIAIDFVGYGVVHDIMAYIYEDTLLFEVDIHHDAMRYVVLLDAESGNVKSLNRHEDESAATAISPYATKEHDATTPSPATPRQTPTSQQPTPTTPRQQTPAPPATSPPTSGQGNRPSNAAISLDRAIEIANADLANRGINATYRSNSGLDWERGQLVWELLFSTHGERMPLIEYYINAENGSIVKFEWDD